MTLPAPVIPCKAGAETAGLGPVRFSPSFLSPARPLIMHSRAMHTSWSLPMTLTVYLLAVTALAARPRPHILKQRNPSYAELTSTSLDELTSLTNMDTILDYTNPDSVLARLLVPRAVGSANLTRVQSMVEAHFVKLGWHAERDTFEADTPYGSKTFSNLIFTHDPEATRRLVLSAHLDSKYFPTHPEDQFVGATDSAAPCAMMMDVASALTNWLDQRRERVLAAGGEEGRAAQGETLQMVFFDGEEAFKDWTATDSIYGAKHLAEKWSRPTELPTAMKPVPVTPIQRISHLVLLDLLGATNPVIRSFFKNTGWFFDEFEHAEQRLGEAGILWPGLEGDDYVSAKGAIGRKERSFFMSRSSYSSWAGNVGDDHEPFLHRGVPVVHLISLPFPRVWHTIKVSHAYEPVAADLCALPYFRVSGRCQCARLANDQGMGHDHSSDHCRISEVGS